MITKEKAVETAKKYLKQKGRHYIYLEEDNIFFTSENITAPEGQDDYELDVAVVSYDVESYDLPIGYFIVINSETGEVLFTRGPHGIIEDRE